MVLIFNKHNNNILLLGVIGIVYINHGQVKVKILLITSIKDQSLMQPEFPPRSTHRGVIRRNVNKLGEDNISHFGLIKAKTTSSLFSETTLIQTFWWCHISGHVGIL